MSLYHADYHADYRADRRIRCLVPDAGIQITVVQTTGLVEYARTVHHTQPTASAALGRTLTITSILGSQLKVDDGSVTVQVKGNGPLGTIVCVSDAQGRVRGYLQNPACDLPLRPDNKLDVGGGVGQGYLNVIKDIGLKEPVTGTVALVNGEIAEDFTRYFAESEQIPSACALGVLVDTDRSIRCAGGYLVQLMPGVQEAAIQQLEQNLAAIPPVTTLLDQGLSLEDIASHVLQGFPVHVLDSAPIGYHCTCTRQKIERALISMGREELQSMAEEDKTQEITCQFCDKCYHFSPDEIRALLQQAIR